MKILDWIVPKVLRVGFERALAPGYGTCYKCQRPWKFVKSHSTQYTETWGCFPLCEGCWSSMTPRERLPYYRQLWLNWGGEETAKDEQHSWPLIKEAVLAEQ